MRFWLILLFVSSLLLADHVQWQSDFEKARAQAVQEKKGLMIFLIAGNDKVAIKMLSHSFRDQSYIACINKNYVSILIQKGQSSSYPIELLYTLAYPSLFFLDNQELFTKETLSGYITAKTLEKHLDCRSVR